MTYDMKDYVEVADRITEFYARYPNGSLRSGEPPYVLDINGRSFVVYHARAFRTPDDPCPADGWAWEPVPGPTQFTKDSELMNAETSAWGRAIVALGFKTKKVASANEVRNRARPNLGGEPQAQKVVNTAAVSPAVLDEPASPPSSNGDPAAGTPFAYDPDEPHVPPLPLTKDQGDKLNKIVGVLRKNGHITTESLWKAMRPASSDGWPRDLDGNLHWNDLRETLNTEEAERLLKRLQKLAARVKQAETADA